MSQQSEPVENDSFGFHIIAKQVTVPFRRGGKSQDWAHLVTSLCPHE